MHVVRHTRTILWTVLASVCATGCAPDAPPADADFAWLEEIEGEAALAWVSDQNETTFARLKTDPWFEDIADQVRDIPSPMARLMPYQLLAGQAYQFVENDEHPRGLWHRTSLAGVGSGNPAWETVLDVDALAAAEGVPWKANFSGSTCLLPDYARCMVALSDGGSDAVVMREFDMTTRTFVEGGFATTTASRTFVAWADSETLLISTDMGEGSLSAAMYPRVLKAWKRGQSLEEATTVMEAQPTDLLGAMPLSFNTASGAKAFVSVIKGMAEMDHYYLDDDLTPTRLPLPGELGFPGLQGVVGNRLIMQTASDWDSGTRTIAGGSLLAFDLEQWLRDPSSDAIDVLFEPGNGRFMPAFFGVAVTADRVAFVVLDNISGTLFSARPGASGWQIQQIDTPPNATISVKGADPTGDMILLQIEGFLAPPRTFAMQEGRLGDPILTDRALFDASRYVVEQHHATSPDGTEIPYFLVRRNDLQFDGTSPTLMYAYGGFGLGMVPSYVGALAGGDVLVPWFEGGGTFVLANIRGGGEFGPDWHKAAVLENRQTAYDDFHAVAEHLIETGVTSPAHLGVKGESNGGLLVSVALTQRPDLYGAVLAGVPLTDMLNYHTMLAGASWMGEYGDPEDPAMRPVLQAYSPFHNIRSDRDYPEAFFYASTADDRVHPGHARKMVAKLQALGHATLYYENTEGGHGASATPEQAAELTAMEAVYLMRRLGLSPGG